MLSAGFACRQAGNAGAQSAQRTKGSHAVTAGERSEPMQ
jgi:hypothetical protein